MKKIMTLILCAALVYGAVVPAAAERIPAGASFEVAFAPDAAALNLVLRGIRGARSSIRVAAYAFTSRSVAQALVGAQRRGVDVRVAADAKAGQGKYSALTYLANKGVPVRLVDAYAIQHNKFMVIDDAHVQTGSFNYTGSAALRNAENVVLLRKIPALAAEYKARWEVLWSQGVDLLPKY